MFHKSSADETDNLHLSVVGRLGVSSLNCPVKDK